MSSETENREDASLYFVMFAGLLAAVIILSRLLHEFPTLNSFFSEASLVLVIGMIAGFVAHNFIHHRDDDAYVGGDGDEMQEEVYRVATHLLSFSPNVFFMALLPPIMFNSGYHLRRELFYRHIQPIVMFACLGTVISALCTGFSLYGIQKLGGLGDFAPSLLELLTFGSLIAATDTVSVLAVFQKKRVDPRLFYLVFGESALNDAVALVLFRTFAGILQDLQNGSESYIKSAGMFLGDALYQGVGSPVLGMLCGFLTALIFKHVDFRQHQTLELPLYLVLLLYVPFIVAECLSLSGIVTIFFCGISARRYVTPTVSASTATAAASIFKVCAYLAETAIFLELGLSVFGLSGSFQWQFILWAFAAALLGRAVGIYPLALIYNLTLKVRIEDLPFEEQPQNDDESYEPPQSKVENPETEADNDSMNSTVSSIASAINSVASTEKASPNDKRKRLKTPLKRQDKHISQNMMHVLCFAGLRGAVAYACVRDFPDLYGHNDEFIAATVVIVLGTIIGMGGATESLLKRLKIDMDVNEEEYMEEWSKRVKLGGTFHNFEQRYIYGCVSRDSDLNRRGNREQTSSVESEYKKTTEMEKAFGYTRPELQSSPYSFGM